MNFRKPEYEVEFMLWLGLIVFNIVTISILISSYAGVNYQNNVYTYFDCTVLSPDSIVAPAEYHGYHLGNFTRETKCYTVKGEKTPVYEGSPRVPLWGIIPFTVIACIANLYLTWRLFWKSGE